MAFKKISAFILTVIMILPLLLTSCAGDESGNGEYTYNTYLSVFPDVWNNHTYQTATDAEILDYTEPGFFSFDYNETKDRYKLVPEMATKEPDDITSDYIGQFGIVEGDKSKAWKITIRDDIMWEDGTPIKAGDFVESVRLLLDPKAQNFRADSLYSGSLVLAGAKNYFYQGGTGQRSVDFETVGIKALSDTELVIILEKELSGFYLLYSLTGNLNLVNTELYKKCISTSGGVYNNTYGTSVDTYMSYGPYKLSEFQDSKSIVLIKNDKWYGYRDEANRGLYQTTRIEYAYIADPETAMLSFLKGDLDVKRLDANQIGNYSKSEYVYYTDGASTFFIAVNPDLEALKTSQKSSGDNINKTILTVKEFRMALSFALDRASFIAACTPTGSPAFAVYNDLIISDPENATPYRQTDPAKKVLAEFWGVADDIGEGKLYENIDDAIASVSGYNLAEGKRLFNAAYKKALTLGLMDEDDIVEIKIGTPNATSTFYKNGYEFLKNCYTEAVRGTSLEGKLKFTLDSTLGNGFGDALRDNQVDMLFGVGWSGSALDPYSLTEAYTKKTYQYDPSWDTSTETIDIKLSDGITYRASVWDWTQAMSGTPITIKPSGAGTPREYSCGIADENPDERLLLLGALEGAILSTCDLIPLTNESSADLKGMQINYYTDEYVFGIGRGGIKYMTYNYTDDEWAAFVRSEGGQLNYK